MTIQSTYTPFVHLILEKTGISIDKDSMGKLVESISFLTADAGMDNLDEYYEFLKNDNDAFCNLLNMLTVNETYFYREPAQINLFTDIIFPEIKQNKKTGNKVKILSAGCSTGEEPYTLVTALMEKYGESVTESVSVFGMDIDSNAVETAKKGFYGKHSFRSVPQKIIDTYFERVAENRYKIKELITNNVVFLHGNLKGDAFDSSLNRLDVIFYRNVSIYFDAKAQKSIFTRLSGLMNKGGYMILSATETLPHDYHIMSLVERNGLFVYQKPHILEDKPEECFLNDEIHMGKKKQQRPKHYITHMGSYFSIDKPVEMKKQDETTPEEKLGKALAFTENKKYEDALHILNDLICQNPLMVKAYTLKASILVNLKQNEEAIRACEIAISKDPLNKENYLICGLVNKMEENSNEAVRRFKEALYVEPSSWIAHFYLAEIYKLEGDKQNAAREYAIVLHILEKGGYLKYGSSYFPMPFQAEDIMRLCRINIKNINNLS